MYITFMKNKYDIILIGGVDTCVEIVQSDQEKEEKRR
jgi:hypothetical protein